MNTHNLKPGDLVNVFNGKTARINQLIDDKNASIMMTTKDGQAIPQFGAIIREGAPQYEIDAILSYLVNSAYCQLFMVPIVILEPIS